MTATVDYAASLRVFHELEVQGRRPPTIREYMRRMGLSSPSVASYRLDGLIELGWIEPLDRGSARSLSVSEKGKRALGIVPAPAPNSKDADYGGCL